MGKHISIFVVAIVIVCVVTLIYKIPIYNSNCTNIKIYKYGTIGKFKLALLGGVHGNEPAGSIGLTKLITSGYFENMANKLDIHIVVIPEANPCGLKQNVRFQPDIIWPDINRNFGSEYGNGIVAQTIIKEFADADLIVDFHEGWSWHQIDHNSVGSTVIPTKVPLAQDISKLIVSNINKTITEKKKQFLVLDKDPCDIKSTLRCSMSKKNINYILVEISGQNNIQPIDIRTNQVIITINSIYEYLAKIKN